jgi:valyl-tRNA synthetase
VLAVRPEDVDFFVSQSAIITSLARCADLHIGADLSKPAGPVSDIVRGVEVHLVVAGKIDFEKERVRLQKEIDRLTSALGGVEKKLSNPNFVANAKPEIIEVERQKMTDWSDALEKLRRNLGSL